jgi:hypothetical protein
VARGREGDERVGERVGNEFNVADDEAGETEKGNVSVREEVIWRGHLALIWWGRLARTVGGDIWRGRLAGTFGESVW